MSKCSGYDWISPPKLRKTREKVELSKSVWDSRRYPSLHLHPTFPTDWRLIFLLIGRETAEIKAGVFYYYFHISPCRRRVRDGKEKRVAVERITDSVIQESIFRRKKIRWNFVDPKLRNDTVVALKILPTIVKNDTEISNFTEILYSSSQNTSQSKCN